MKLLPKLLAATSIFAATAAIAGPPVTVTFKNQATAEATYTIVTSNETSTYANASPKPTTKRPAGTNDVYTVTSLISPDVNYANVRQGAKRKRKASGRLAAEGEAFPLPNLAVGTICCRYGTP